MIFEWSEIKRLSNLRKYGLDFSDAASISAGTTVTFVDDRFDYGETWFFTFGLLQGRVAAIAHTETMDAARIISMRKANRHEQTAYFQTIAD